MVKGIVLLALRCSRYNLPLDYPHYRRSTTCLAWVVFTSGGTSPLKQEFTYLIMLIYRKPTMSSRGPAGDNNFSAGDVHIFHTLYTDHVYLLSSRCL